MGSVLGPHIIHLTIPSFNISYEMSSKPKSVAPKQQSSQAKPKPVDTHIKLTLPGGVSKSFNSFANAERDQGIANPQMPNREESIDFTDKWMSNNNPYLATLRNPFGVGGAKIPDGAAPMTAVMQVTQRFILTTDGTSGLAGVMLGYCGTGIAAGTYMVPQEGITSTIGGGSTNGAMFLTCDASASTNAFFSESTTSSGSQPGTITGLSAFLDSYSAKTRVVSAGINLQPAASLSNCSGYYVVGSLNANQFNSQALTAVTSLSNLLAQPTAVPVPIYNPSAPGVTATMSPMDNTCLAFADMGKTTVAYTDDDINASNPAILYAVVVGATSVQHILTITLNYECVLKTQNIGYGASRTLMDPLALATAFNARRDDPVAFAGSSMTQLSLQAATNSGSVPSVTTLSLSQHTRAGPVITLKGGLQSHAAPTLTFFMKPVWVPHTLRFKTMQPNLANMQVSGTASTACYPACTVDRRRKGAAQLEEMPAQDRPLFESLVDTLGGVVKKGLPKLFPFLADL